MFVVMRHPEKIGLPWIADFVGGFAILALCQVCAMEMKLKRNDSLTVFGIGGVLTGLFLLLSFFQCSSQLWQSLGFQLDQQPLVLYSDSSDDLLYIGGAFQHVNGANVDGLIAYDGFNWDSVGLNFPGYETKALLRHDGKLWAGGSFQLGYLDGQQWVNFLVNGTVNALLSFDGNLIAAGGFDAIDGVQVNNLAAYDGQTWTDYHGSDTAISSSLCIIYALEEFDGNLIVGGNIDQLGPMKEVLQWDGQEWKDLAGGIGGAGFVQVLDLEVFNGDLYVAGQFEEGNNGPGNNIARWDGTQWSRVGEGVGPGQVYQLFTNFGRLNVAGSFLNAGGIAADFIAAWDGAQWCAFAGHLDSAPKPMASYKGQFYMGGSFSRIGTDSLLYLAQWLGGNHVDSCIVVPLGLFESAEEEEVFLFPNPTHSTFTLTLPPSSPAAEIRVLDLAGREALAPWKYAGGEVDVAHLPAGLYFVEVMLRGKKQVIKLVKE